MRNYCKWRFVSVDLLGYWTEIKGTILSDFKKKIQKRPKKMIQRESQKKTNFKAIASFHSPKHSHATADFT